jgi:hypothetical protein
MKHKIILQFVSWLGLSTALWVDNAYAYLDPAVGSMFLQSVIAAVCGGIFLVKSYWHKLKSIFSSKKKEDITSKN